MGATCPLLAGCAMRTHWNDSSGQQSQPCNKQFLSSCGPRGAEDLRHATAPRATADHLIIYIPIGNVCDALIDPGLSTSGLAVLLPSDGARGIVDDRITPGAPGARLAGITFDEPDASAMMESASASEGAHV